MNKIFKFVKNTLIILGCLFILLFGFIMCDTDDSTPAETSNNTETIEIVSTPIPTETPEDLKEYAKNIDSHIFFIVNGIDISVDKLLNSIQNASSDYEIYKACERAQDNYFSYINLFNTFEEQNLIEENDEISLKYLEDAKIYNDYFGSVCYTGLKYLENPSDYKVLSQYEDMLAMLTLTGYLVDDGGRTLYLTSFGFTEEEAKSIIAESK